MKKVYTPSEYQSSLKSNEIFSPRIECEKNLANTIFFPCSWLTLQPPMAIKRSVHSRQLFTFELQWKIIQLYTAPNLNVIYFACSARIYCVSVYWLCALVFKLWLVFFSSSHACCLALRSNHLAYLLNTPLKNRKLSCAGAANAMYVLCMSSLLGCRELCSGIC